MMLRASVGTTPCFSRVTRETGLSGKASDGGQY
jgi:hypothetical protein